MFDSIFKFNFLSISQQTILIIFPHHECLAASANVPTTKALALLLIFRFKEGAQVLIVLEANILLLNFGGRRYLCNLFVNCLSVADSLAAHLTRIAV